MPGVTIGTMAPRSAALVIALSLAICTLTNCAKRHHAATAAPPAPRIQAVETGLASWYGHPYHGRPAANGEIYDMESFTAAHRTLPFGTRVRVTNLTNQKTVEVRIIDRGPFVDGRIIDLSHIAAQNIDLIGPGVAPVRIEIVSLPAITASDDRYAVQAGAFLDKDRAERLCSLLEREDGPARLVLRGGDQALWRVLVGNEPTQAAAEALARRVRQQAGNAFVVRLDTPATASAAQAQAASEP